MTIDIIPLTIDKAVLIKLENKGGLRLELCNFGAGIVALYAPDKNGASENVVLTFADIEEYFFATQYFGKTIGRTAGRLPNSMIKINHESYALEGTFGKHTLHGGRHSLAFKLFQFKLLDFGATTSVQFKYISPFGEGGYPGQVTFVVTYHLDDAKNEVLIEYEAKTDFPTPVNLTNHSYFNLSGDVKRDVREHVMTLNAPFFHEIDAELILNQKLPVTKIMDFRSPKTIGTHLDERYLQDSKAFGYDHTFRTNGESVAITLSDPVSGRLLTMTGDYPAVNVYTDNYPSGRPLRSGQSDHRYAGVAIEPEYVPTEFDSYILEPEATYRHHIRLSFGLLP